SRARRPWACPRPRSTPPRCVPHPRSAAISARSRLGRSGHPSRLEISHRGPRKGFGTFPWNYQQKESPMARTSPRASDIAAEQVEAIISAAHDAAEEIKEEARAAARHEAAQISADAGAAGERLRSQAEALRRQAEAELSEAEREADKIRADAKDE